jgi:phosphopantothenoylcysteine decarboxylase / phosphopantothenate---cysteine ligase
MHTAFRERNVVLGITGSIAAYKACELASRLVEYGAHVRPVLTRSAAEMVGPASLTAITGNTAITGLFDESENPEIEHISIATSAHLFLIAPATANILAKAARGAADDWLSTALLATRAPILFAPSMNTNMYTHPATQVNLDILRARGCRFVGPDSGRLACRTIGPGRMADPAAILEAAIPLVSDRHDFAGRDVVITSGPTHEPIDPVRFIGNRSSGKMGRAIAIELLARGANVTAVVGPMSEPMPSGVRTINVETANEMAESAVSLAQDADVFIGCAAVGDFRPEEVADLKRKRDGKGMVIKLVENPDIISLVGAIKREHQVVVGFAAETDQLLSNARQKLEKKNLDLIVANEVGSADGGFGSGNVRAAILDDSGGTPELKLQPKEVLAEALADRISGLLDRPNSGSGRAWQVNN